MDAQMDEADFNYVQDHWDDLCKQYKNEWIAVIDQQVVAHAPRLVTMRDMQFEKVPFFDFIYGDCDKPVDIDNLTLPIIAPASRIDADPDEDLTEGWYPASEDND